MSWGVRCWGINGKEYHAKGCAASQQAKNAKERQEREGVKDMESKNVSAFVRRHSAIADREPI